MTKFYTLTVREVTRETADAVSIAFDVPKELKEEYRFKHGQYLTLKFTLGGEEIRRSYSICSSPLEPDELRVAVKRVKGGKVSNYMFDSVKAGDQIEVMTPMGAFTSEMDPSHTKNYVLFAGGSGITPMLSILKTVLASEPKSTVVLLYGNNDVASIIFLAQIEELAEKYSERFQAVYIVNTPSPNHPLLYVGLMTVENNLVLMEKHVEPSLDNEFFICGPTPMMDNVVAALQKLQTPKEKIHIEYFSAPTEPVEAITAEEKINYYEGSSLTVIMDGDEYETTMLPGEAVLFAAKRIGLDAPYSCQNGSCSTCRAKLVSGKVHMHVNFALNADNLAHGFILTCQSRPLTSEITVNYDEAM